MLWVPMTVLISVNLRNLMGFFGKQGLNNGDGDGIEHAGYLCVVVGYWEPYIAVGGRKALRLFGMCVCCMGKKESNAGESKTEWENKEIKT